MAADLQASTFKAYIYLLLCVCVLVATHLPEAHTYPSAHTIITKSYNIYNISKNNYTTMYCNVCKHTIVYGCTYNTVVMMQQFSLF